MMVVSLSGLRTGQKDYVNEKFHWHHQEWKRRPFGYVAHCPHLFVSPFLPLAQHTNELCWHLITILLVGKLELSNAFHLGGRSVFLLFIDTFSDILGGESQRIY